MGASAYRAGEKLHSIAHASYQSGEKLCGIGDKVTHDYTRKGGVTHSEIILPENAPPEYANRQTLWNAVEKSEKRKDAQLAREFIVGLQREFKLREQIEVLHEYIKENFVNKGMIADFAIHDNKDGNPHAHIMLTTRHVTPEGFGKKNTDWNKKDLFSEWRKGWADVNNRMFERLGREERIDHRSYREQGIDREPMVHLGYEAAALERQGVQTERGNHNREVQRRNLNRLAEGVASEVRNQKFELAHTHAANAEREAQKETQPLKVEKTKQNTEELRQIAKEVKLEKELQKIRDAQKTARHMEKPIEPEAESPFVSELERQLKAEKAMQHLEKMQEQRNNAEQIAKRMTALKESFIALEKEKTSLMESHNQIKLDLPPLEYRTELVEEHAQNIENLQSRAAQLHESRQNLRLFDVKKKKETDAQIAQAEQELARAQDFFKNHFHINPSQARDELKRLQEEFRTKQKEQREKSGIIQAIRDKQNSLELAYHTQKLLNETRPDHEQITRLLEQTHHPPEPIREKLLREQIEHRLNTIGDYEFQKVIDNLNPYQAHILTAIREQAKKHERLIEQEKEHSRTIDRGR